MIKGSTQEEDITIVNIYAPPPPQKKEMPKIKMAVGGGLTNRCKKKRSEKQRRKGKTYPFECRVPNNSKER